MSENFSGGLLVSGLSVGETELELTAGNAVARVPVRVLPADAITNGDFARNGEDWVTSSSGITFDKTTDINGLRKPYCNMYGNGNWIEQ